MTQSDDYRRRHRAQPLRPGRARRRAAARPTPRAGCWRSSSATRRSRRPGRRSRRARRCWSPTAICCAPSARPTRRARSRRARSSPPKCAIATAPPSAARVATALVTPAPFAERLVHFWANHFAVSVEKPSLGSIAGAFEAEAIRPHVFGRSRTLLLAVERHPAMLIYLDQVALDRPGERRRAACRRGRPGAQARPQREPRARDPRAAHDRRAQRLQPGRRHRARARAHRLERRRRGRPVLDAAGIEPGRFVFVPALHEPGARNVLGERYEACRRRAGARHPAPARGRAGDGAPHRDQAGAPLRRRCAGAGAGRSAGRAPSCAAAATCRRVYRALIASPEAWQPAPVKFKTPWEWTMSTLARPRLARPARPGGRADAGAARPADVAARLAGRLRRHRGELGRARRADASRRAGAALRRARRQHASMRASLAPQLLPGGLSSGAPSTAIARADSPATALALLLVSPEFLRR